MSLTFTLMITMLTDYIIVVEKSGDEANGDAELERLISVNSSSHI